MPTPPRSPLPPWLASKAASSSPRSAATPTSSAPLSTQRATTSASPPPDHGRTAHPAWSPHGAKRAQPVATGRRWDQRETGPPRGSATRTRQSASGVQAEVEQVFFKDRKSTRLNSSHGYISYAVF